MDDPKDPKDTSQTGDSSGGEQGTSDKTPETFTEKDVQKAVSDALSVAGRDAKSLEKREEAIKKASERIVEAERGRKEAELEAARDDPDKLTAIQARHKQKERETELDRRDQELKDREEKATEALKEADKGKKERNALVIAQKHDVDVESLVKFTDGSAEAMEDLARVLPKKGEAKPPIKPDSGTTTGGDTMPDSAKGKMRAGWDELHKS